MRIFHTDNTIPPVSKTPKAPPVIWVFGSNEAGRHGAGEAKVAHVTFGAQYGAGKGLTGHSYAIPTKSRSLGVLPLPQIEASVAEFLDYARANPATNFYVTRVGCGLAGFKDEVIGSMFASAPENCSLPSNWKEFVEREAPSQRRHSP